MIPLREVFAWNKEFVLVSGSLDGWKRERGCVVSGREHWKHLECCTRNVLLEVML